MNDDNKNQGNIPAKSAETGEMVIRKKKKRLKYALIIVISALALLYLIVNVTSWIGDMMLKRKQEAFEELIKRPSITFYKENYGENIFDNAVYMEMDRNIRYTEDVQSFYLSEDEDYSKYSYELEFMAGLIDKIIRGDADGYNAAFTANYFTKNEDQYRERFTMQMLYNIEIELLKKVEGDNVSSVEDGVFYYVNTDFKVSYEIYRNNGSFRVDLDDNARIPIVYKIWAKYKPGLLEPFEIKIYEVINYSKYESGLFG